MTVNPMIHFHKVCSLFTAPSTYLVVDEANESDISPILVFELREIESINVFLPNRFRSTFRSEQVTECLIDTSEPK